MTGPSLHQRAKPASDKLFEERAAVVTFVNMYYTQLFYARSH